MSALAYLAEYDSGSDESEENNKPVHKKLKLEVPNLDKVAVVSVDEYIDIPQNHNGRVRTFPHIRGNWPSFVYVKYPKEEFLQNLIDKIELMVKKEFKDCCHKCEDFHISLSKTVVLQYHLIKSFTKSLQECFSNVKCFELAFSSVNIYSNEDGTRTFISLKVDYNTAILLLKITQKVDQVLKEFRLPVFYEEPSFHMSIFWLEGNKKAELVPFLDHANVLLAEEFRNIRQSYFINALNCKIGNKYFQFALQ